MNTPEHAAQPIIETERLVLIPPSLVKAEQLLHYLETNRAFHERWEPVREERYYTIPSVQELLDSQIRQVESFDALHFYLTHNGSDEILGKVSCSQIVPYPFYSTFVGYSLSHHHIHRGYMSEALRAVLGYGCTVRKLHRFEANIMPGNQASIHVALAAGFTYEGYSPDYLLIRGVWEGHEHYVYINSEWQDG
ncbi:MAG: GNAT family N-acetyltransferase [Sphaerochaetaceae bacterium]|nr:GNAT family N-acetyltransferase [Sphaerochaetaceae bacterium]